MISWTQTTITGESAGKDATTRQTLTKIIERLKKIEQLDSEEKVPLSALETSSSVEFIVQPCFS
jgi:hypothetical protein